jgi:hypothetical protein
MSTLNAALQHRLQKMERQVTALHEENLRLRAYINEAAQPVYGGGQFSGAALGAALAQGQGATDAYMSNFVPQLTSAPVAQYGGGRIASSRTSLPTVGGPRGGSPISASMGGRSTGQPGAAAAMAAPGVGAGGVDSTGFDGAMLGALLAQAGQDGGAAANAYLNQFGYSLNTLDAGGVSNAPTSRRGRGGLGRI